MFKNISEALQSIRSELPVVLAIVVIMALITGPGLIAFKNGIQPLSAEFIGRTIALQK